MNSLTEIPPALSIRQPWVDLILRGDKTIEVRAWRIKHRGPVLIHVSGTIDWKTAELFGYDDVLDLPRGGLVGIAEILDVFEFTRESWLEMMPRHLVVHPPVREPVYGVVLGGVIAMSHRIPCRGRALLFPIPRAIEARTKRELATLGLLHPTG